VMAKKGFALLSKGVNLSLLAINPRSANVVTRYLISNLGDSESLIV
jgi:hypothetical protein